MSLFGNVLTPKRAESVAFIEIAADSVGGAYARFEEGRLPKLVYTAREPLAPHEGEEVSTALSRALSTLSDALIREGAPALSRAVGHGTIDAVIVSIASPWQEAVLRAEKFESARPFTFTHSLLAEALERSPVPAAGKVVADESVIATVLNGYETSAPLGKEVSRASVLILTATVDAAIAEVAASVVRSLYHTHATGLTAFAHIEYVAVRALFPHEEEYLVIETRGGATSIMLVKRNCLAGVMSVVGSSGDVRELKGALDALSVDHPLPHTIFLLANENERESLKASIESAHFETFWLSETAPRVVAIRPDLMAPHLQLLPDASHDLFLSLAALSYAQGLRGKSAA